MLSDHTDIKTDPTAKIKSAVESKAAPEHSSRELVINVEQISKRYESYQKPIHRLWQSFASTKQYYQEFWALQNVDLQVYKGETVGIVGKNGSGKSTLLQIISGILQPTNGQFETNGRISALLELGAGFNPEFTGMENARLNASIMGLSRDEFHQKLPDIVEFCGLGEFLHRPVKTYSSGMFVRLAFAVAINMNPDILIIDEALAVGDVRFQRKCFRRLDQLKEQGVSILFVTHSTASVIQYCDRAIMLDEGQLQMTGTPKAVVQKYLEMMFESDAVVQENVEFDAANYNVDFDPQIDNCIEHPTYNKNEHRWGDGRAKICHYELLQNGIPSNGLVQRGAKLKLRISILFAQEIEDLIYGVTVKTNDGNEIYGTNSRLTGDLPVRQSGGDLASIEVNLKLNLLAGDYFVSIGVAQDHIDKDNIAIDRRYDMIHLHVGGTPDSFGVADLAGSMHSIASDLDGGAG